MSSESLLSATISKGLAIGSLNKISVLDPDQDIFNVIRGLANSGVQEEAFYVLDVDDIVRKHNEWKQKMPRVKPFYGIKKRRIKLYILEKKIDSNRFFTFNHFKKLSNAILTTPFSRRWLLLEHLLTAHLK